MKRHRRMLRRALVLSAMLVLASCGSDGTDGETADITDGLVAHYPLDGNADDLT